jgi:ABC-2 type transport system permease protein
LVRVSWFGFETGSTHRTLVLSDTWAAAGEPLLVLTVWAVLATVLARRSMRWEPRS